MQQLINLRKQMAEKYAKSDEKPIKRICDKCLLDVDCNIICKQTGFYHNKNKTRIGGDFFDKKENVFTSDQIMSAINASRIKWQAARVKKVIIYNEPFVIFKFSAIKKQKKIWRFIWII